MEEGTIVHVDYELYNNESGDLIETTREDVAKEQEMHQEGRSYSPMVCVVGGGNLIPGFEAALADAKANKEIEVVIEAADAYGEKDPEQIETISIDKLIRAVKDPNSLYIGAPVNIGNRQGYLSYLAAGRARVDYNHPMAGKTLKYSFKCKLFAFSAIFNGLRPDSKKAASNKAADSVDKFKSAHDSNVDF